MEYKFIATPITRRSLTTEKVMLRLLLGLLIVYAYGLYNAYQISISCMMNALLLLLVSLIVGTVTEVVFALVTKQKPLEFLRKSFHYITCLILVLIVPPYTSLYAMGVATFISLFFGKLVFGGFGQNIFNPAAVGRAIIASSFAGMVTADAVTSPTIATAFANMNWVSDASNFIALSNTYNLGSILLGSCTGAIGESFIIVIVVGILLSFIDVIDWRIPVTYIGLIFVGATITGLTHGLGIDYALAFTASGGVAFGGVFMLTDPVTNPQTRPGKIVFAAIAAVLTIIIRYLGNMPEGVVFSILLVNILAPAIDILFSSKQITSYKRNVGIVFGTIIAVLVIIVCVGNFVEPGTYAASVDKEDSTSEPIESNTTVSVSLSDDLSSEEAIIISIDGNTYHVSSGGIYGIPNEFDIVVEDGKIVSIICTSFNDTEGYGDEAITDSYLASFKGATLDSVVDAKTGATLTSNSIIAACQIVLKEVSK